MSEQLTLGSVATLPGHLTDGFDLFWKAFPKRPNNPKEPARIAWAKALRTTTISEIMDGLARYEFSPDPKFRPMASTWLNQRRFECVNENLDTDSFGIAEWMASLPRDGSWSALCYDVEEIRHVLVATGWPSSWRGSLDTLNDWLRAGYTPESITKVIASAVYEFGTRSTLAAFDKRVRFRAERIIGI